MLPTLLYPVFLTVLCLAAADPPDRPPLLTFDKHVDYIAWYNEFVSKGKKDNAYELYKGLWPDENGHGGFSAWTGEAEKQSIEVYCRAWEPEAYPELAAYLDQCAPHLDTFKKAVKPRDFWLPAPGNTKLLYDLAFPSVAGNRAAANALIVQALMRQNDQPKAVLDACRVLLQDANHMQQWGILIGAMVSAAEQSLVHRLTCTVLAEGVIDGRDIASLYATIRRYDPGPPDSTRWLVFEWAATLDMLQSVCPNGNLNTDAWKSVCKGIGQAETSARKPPSTSFDPRETAQLIESYFAGAQAIAAGPLSLVTVSKFEEFEKEQRPKLMNNSFTAVFTPTYANACHLLLRTEAQRRATLLILAIHAHHAKHGKWPEGLDKIDKNLGLKGLKKLREDPFSDKDFIYKLKDGRPLLYTVASNGKDDGGRHDKKWGDGEADSDYVFWPFQR